MAKRLLDRKHPIIGRCVGLSNTSNGKLEESFGDSRESFEHEPKLHATKLSTLGRNPHFCKRAYGL